MFGLFKKKETSPIPERRGKRDEIVSFSVPLLVISMKGASVLSKYFEYVPREGEWVWLEKRERKREGIGSHETVVTARFRAYADDMQGSWAHFETYESELGKKDRVGARGELFGDWYITGPVIKEG